MSIKILIVNYNSAELLSDCLDSLELSPSDRVVIVDNASNEEDRRVLAEVTANRPQIRVEFSSTNVGFGAGVNLASSLADIQVGDFVWVLNPDTVCEGDPARTLAAFLRDGNADIVSPLLTTGHEDNRRVWFAGGDVEKAQGRSTHWNYDRPVGTVQTAPFTTTFVSGAAPMFTAKAWLALEGFRENLFLYWEDADLSLRAQTLGLRAMVDPSAVVWHQQGGSTGVESGASATYYYYAQRNRLVVCGEYSNRFDLAFGRGLAETLRLLAKPILTETPPRRAKLSASLRGIAHGLAARTGAL